jgi:hypothetical protein
MLNSAKEFLMRKNNRLVGVVMALLLHLPGWSGVTGLLVAGEADYALAKLPLLPRAKPQVVDRPLALKEFAPGVQVAIGQAVGLTGTLIIDQGPVDGLEVLACLASGKTHESLVRLDAASGQLVKAAFIAALGLPDGMPATEGSAIPGRGVPLRVELEWEPLDQPGKWYSIDASCLIRDRITDQSYPAVPFIFTGSRFLLIDETTPDGRPVKQERFMLDNSKSVINLVDEPDGLFASPSPGAHFDKHFEVNSGISPPANSKVRLVFTKTTLPLTLTLDAGGVLLAAEQPLDDQALQALLSKHFGPGTTPNQRAVGILVEATSAREQDVAARARMLAAAAAAQAWVVPVFILSDKKP